jgi:hypothetical protein
MGWPEENPPDPGRLPLDAVVHSETYRDFDKDEIETIYSEKESREDSKQFVLENHKETLAQVFTDIRYKKNDNEHFSRRLLEFLKDQGFMNQ